MPTAAVLAAFQSAAVEASGIPASRVIRRDQDGPQPSMPYVCWALGPLSEVGRDSVSEETDVDADAGEEIVQRVVGLREATWSVEVYSEPASGLTAADAAVKIAERVRSKVKLPAVRALLGAVNVSAFDVGPTQRVPEIAGTVFRGHAVVDVRCYLRPDSEIVERTGYIETVEGTATVGDTEVEFTAAVE